MATLLYAPAVPGERFMHGHGAMKEALAIIKDTFKDFSEDKCARMAAALSYYTVFSLPALLILVLAIVGFFVDPGAAQGRFDTERLRRTEAQVDIIPEDGGVAP